jgi:hypothetical protein
MGQSFYSDANLTLPMSGSATVEPGGKLYVKITARNVGSQSWARSSLKIGTAAPYDRVSKFYDPSWLNTGRTSLMQQQTTVRPGEDATFVFALKSPLAVGEYTEFFNLVIEGVTWLNDNIRIPINVVDKASPSNSSRVSLSVDQNLKRNEYLLSPDRQSVLVLRDDGDLVLYNNFKKVWASGTAGSGSDLLAMQPDGNLVLYSGQSVKWASYTFGYPNSSAHLQTDGNLVIYDAALGARWATYTASNPSNLGYVNNSVSESVIYPGQMMQNASRKYSAILQSDGNFVIYKDGTAMWESGTYYARIGKKVKLVAMQSDGNMVIYDVDSKPIWSSGSYGNVGSRLVMQSDGNLVIYKSNGTPVWATNTVQR